jgi:hypothetical protein
MVAAQRRGVKVEVLADAHMNRARRATRSRACWRRACRSPSRRATGRAQQGADRRRRGAGCAVLTGSYNFTWSADNAATPRTSLARARSTARLRAPTATTGSASRAVVGRIQNAEGFSCQVLGGRYHVQHHGLVPGDGLKQGHHRGVAAIHEEGVVPAFDHEFVGNALDVGKVHHHAIDRQAVGLDDLARQGHLDRVAVAVQMAALAGVVGDPVSGIEFETTGDAHGGPHLTDLFQVGADYSIAAVRHCPHAKRKLLKQIWFLVRQRSAGGAAARIEKKADGSRQPLSSAIAALSVLSSLRVLPSSGSCRVRGWSPSGSRPRPRRLS